MDTKESVAKELLTALENGKLDDAKKEILKVRKLNPDYQWVAVYHDDFWATNEDWIVNNLSRTYPLREVRIGFSGELFCC